MYTFNDLISFVKHEARDAIFSQYSQDRISKEINNSYINICSQFEFSFRETTKIIGLTAGNRRFDLPEDFDPSNVDKTKVYLGTPSINTEMDYYPSRNVPDATSTGTPEIWWNYGGLGYVYPTPSTAHNLEFQYYLLPPEMVNGDDLPIIPAAYADVIAWDALTKILPADDTNFVKAQTMRAARMDELTLKYINKQPQYKQRVVEDAYPW